MATTRAAPETAGVPMTHRAVLEATSARRALHAVALVAELFVREVPLGTTGRKDERAKLAFGGPA